MGFNDNDGINQLKAAALKFLEGVEETAKQANLEVRWKCEAYVIAMTLHLTEKSAKQPIGVSIIKPCTILK